MKVFILFSISVLILFFLAGCERDAMLEPQENTTVQTSVTESENNALIAQEVMSTFGWQIDEEAEIPAEFLVQGLEKPAGRILNFERQVLTGKIVHYKFQIQVGPDPYDVIGIHRVVKEKKAYKPMKTKKTFFFQHGDAKDFEGMMLPGIRQLNTPDDFGLAIYLAENKVDVWGIDQAWTLVPAGVTDFTFMADWGMQKQIDDLSTAMSIARILRLFTGSGYGKMILCGYSSGVTTGFSLLNAETQLPNFRKNVSGFVPVDLAVKTDNQPIKDVFLNDSYAMEQMLNNGIYQFDIPFALIGNLARTDPNGASPLIPGFTNQQTMMYFAGGPIFGVFPFHYFAPTSDNQSFQYTSMDEVLDFLEAAVPYEPVKFMFDYDVLISEREDSPFDDYFSQITVPIYNIAAAGGFAEYSIYGTTLMGSTDVTNHIVRLHPIGDEVFDFGHIDIFTAYNAESEVWQPLLQWIKTH